MIAWVNGPELSDLRNDLKIPDNITADDVALQLELDAAVAYVIRQRGDLNFSADPLSCNPDPDAAVFLGTIRLAARWFTRRRSPDALISMGDLGTARVPSVDPDIERLCGIGRFKRPTFA